MMKISVFLIVSGLIPFCRSLEGIINVNLVRDKCFHRSVAQIIRCQLTFAQNVNKSVGRRPLAVNTTDINESQLKTVCCGLWDMTTCMKSSAIKYSNCKLEVLRNFIRDVEEIKRRKDFKHCYNHYKEGSISCGFPVWATITLVAVSVALVAILTCFVHKCCARRQMNNDLLHLIEH